jgi:hypothetical protein
MANPEGQTSITGTARLVPATFYIAITPLSGRTTERRISRDWRDQQLSPCVTVLLESERPYRRFRAANIYAVGDLVIPHF